ncbi:hypothetical protein MTO96_013502 [Rhipicephalus appendiculatus]
MAVLTPDQCPRLPWRRLLKPCLRKTAQCERVHCVLLSRATPLSCTDTLNPGCLSFFRKLSWNWRPQRPKARRPLRSRPNPPIPSSLGLRSAAVYIDMAPGAAGGQRSFRCRDECRVANNEDCHDGYLKTCPTDQAYDVCMTMVVKNAQQGFFIEKKCALGPCNLRDEKQSQGLGLDTCDRSKDSYSCFECCKGDGCNTNAARRELAAPLPSLAPASPAPTPPLASATALAAEEGRWAGDGPSAHRRATS